MVRFAHVAVAAAFLLGGSSFAIAQTATPAPRTTPYQKALSEAEAKKKIEGSGYTEVTGLKVDGKGNWTATAMKGGKKVPVAVSRTGKLTQGKAT